MPAVLAKGRRPFPMPRRPVLGARKDGVWHWGMRTPNAVSTPPGGWFLGRVVRAFAPHTQSMGRTREHSAWGDGVGLLPGGGGGGLNNWVCGPCVIYQFAPPLAPMRVGYHPLGYSQPH